MCRAAFDINMQFYGDLNYMWCTPYFRPDVAGYHYTVPRSSSPFEIYRQLEDEIAGSDLHAEKISSLRLGIKKGAMAMKDRNKINEKTMQKICAIADNLAIAQFSPLLCVIPRLDMLGYSREPAVDKMANPLSMEYILTDVPRSAFDVITIT